jgi:thiamine biosynthesis protein ThiS
VEKKIMVNNQILEWQENMTVDQILKIMNYTFKMIIVKVNGELVKREKYKTENVPVNARVEVIHLVAGG